MSGIKHDADKPRWGLVPADAMTEAVYALTYGAQKYDDHNWSKGITYERYYSALMRHMTAWWGGERNDPESGLHHIAHAICCALFLLAYELRGMRKWDDRPGSKGCQCEALQAMCKAQVDTVAMLEAQAIERPKVGG